MHYVYSAMDGNARFAVRIYLEHFPSRRAAKSGFLWIIAPQIALSRSFNHIGRTRATCTPVVEQTMLQEFDSTRKQVSERVRVLGIHCSSIMCILHE